jgi:hypothetical protein
LTLKAEGNFGKQNFRNSEEILKNKTALAIKMTNAEKFTGV